MDNYTSLQCYIGSVWHKPHEKALCETSEAAVFGEPFIVVCVVLYSLGHCYIHMHHFITLQLMCSKATSKTRGRSLPCSF